MRKTLFATTAIVIALAAGSAFAADPFTSPDQRFRDLEARVKALETAVAKLTGQPATAAVAPSAPAAAHNVIEPLPEPKAAPAKEEGGLSWAKLKPGWTIGVGPAPTDWSRLDFDQPVLGHFAAQSSDIGVRAHKGKVPFGGQPAYYGEGIFNAGSGGVYSFGIAFLTEHYNSISCRLLLSVDGNQVAASQHSGSPPDGPDWTVATVSLAEGGHLIKWAGVCSGVYDGINTGGARFALAVQRPGGDLAIAGPDDFRHQ